MQSRPAIIHYFGLEWLTSRHPSVRRMKKKQTAKRLHGNKTWRASPLLIDYLIQHPLDPGSKVLDLGCGWGMTSLFCSKFQQCEVWALDADPEVFPFLMLQAEHNHVAVHTLTQDFASLTETQLAEVDVLLGSDICFWDEMAEDLLGCIERALDAGVKRVIISDPNRPPFLAVAEACIDAFFAELLPWQSAEHPRSKGSILVIENA